MFRLHPQLAADTIILGDLPLCQVLLMNDSRYPWLILVPRHNGVEEIYQLDSQARQQLQQESSAISHSLMTHFDGDKLNVAALGNVVSQLHIHHIVRFKTDPAWPKPVWGALATLPYGKEDLVARAFELKTLLSAQTDFIAC